MPVYRPRMYAELTVPVMGSSRLKDQQAKGETTVKIPVRVHRASWIKNDHNHADELDLTVEWNDAGVDPRFLKNATVSFWMDNVEIGQDLVPTDDNLRFVGIATRVRRVARDGSGLAVDMSFLDYTTLFLASKPFPTKGVPTYDMNLVDAWARICDNVGWADPKEPSRIISTVAHLRNRLLFQLPPGAKSPTEFTLRDAVSERFAKLASIPIRPKADAWEVWQQVVGMHGLLSFIDKDVVVVTDTLQHYATVDSSGHQVNTAPRLIWAKNILMADEAVNTNFSNKGVSFSSYDPLSGKVIEVFVPKFFDPEIQGKNVVAVSRKSSPEEQQSDRYDYFEYNGITNIDTLTKLAEGAYNERSRQEIEGTIKTCEMFVDAVNGTEIVGLMDLSPGDAIRIEIGENEKDLLKSKGDDKAQIDYLTGVGYSKEVASLIAQNMDPFSQLEPTFHVKRIHVNLETTEDGGSFEIEITYNNRIKVTGDTDDARVS